MNSRQTFTVIFGDLIGSSSVEDRVAKAKQISEIVDQLGLEYASDFHAPLVVARGMDEISGVLKRPKSSFLICRSLNEAVFPLYFRFAIVQQSLDVGIESRDPRRMDGAAFHIAAHEMEELKKNDMIFSIRLLPPADKFNPFLTQLANLYSIIAMGRSEHQNHLIRQYRRLGRQADVARSLGVFQQAVSNSMRAARFKELRRVEELIDSFLDTVES